MKKLKFSCSGHVDELVDDFLEEVYQMPIIEEVYHTEVSCDLCDQIAIYQLTGSDVKITWE